MHILRKSSLVSVALMTGQLTLMPCTRYANGCVSAFVSKPSQFVGVSQVIKSIFLVCAGTATATLVRLYASFMQTRPLQSIHDVCIARGWYLPLGHLLQADASSNVGNSAAADPAAVLFLCVWK